MLTLQQISKDLTARLEQLCSYEAPAILAKAEEVCRLYTDTVRDSSNWIIGIFVRESDFPIHIEFNIYNTTHDKAYNLIKQIAPLGIYTYWNEDNLPGENAASNQSTQTSIDPDDAWERAMGIL